MEKNKSLRIKGFFDEKRFYEIYKSGINIKKSFIKEFGIENSEYVGKEFKKYFNKLLKHSNGKETKRFLLDFKETFEGHFYSLIYKELFLLIKLLRQHTQLIQSQIFIAISNLNFFSDLTMAVMLGNLNEFSQMVKRVKVMTGKKLESKKEQEYLSILNLRKKLITKYGYNSKTSLSNAIRVFYRNNISKEKIKSIAGSIKYHQSNSKLPTK